MDACYFYEQASGHGLPHDPLKAIVAPRPIGWISTVDRAGRVNLAPYSFFNMVSDTPPMLMFSSNGLKDTIRNVAETGEFVCNLAGIALAEAMNATSAAVPHDVDEMERAGLERAPCRLVRPPRVVGAAAALECCKLSITHLSGLDGAPSSNHLVIGQIVGVHIDRRFLVDGRFDTAAAAPLGRCGYRGDYVAATAVFEMLRPG